MFDNTYLTFLSSLIQVIAAFMGIIAVILIFIMDIKLGQAKNIWDELSIKYSNNELDKINVKRYLILYNSKLLDIRLDSFFNTILTISFLLSSFILINSFFILIIGFYNFESIYLFFLMLLLIGVFLILIYQILNAPFSRIFNKWKIEQLLRQPQYSFLSDYIGSFDLEDIKYLFIRRDKPILVDTSRDAGIVRIILSTFLAGFVLMFINRNYSIIDMTAVALFYLGILILYLNNKTTMEYTPDSITIHKPLLKSVTIETSSIRKIEVAKNPGYKPRWIFRVIALVGLLFLLRINMTSLLINLTSAAPFIVKCITAFSIPLTTVLFIVIFYSYHIRSRYSNILKLKAGDREITFYTNDPHGLSWKLGVY